jgi:hypothetical protein
MGEWTFDPLRVVCLPYKFAQSWPWWSRRGWWGGLGWGGDGQWPWQEVTAMVAVVKNRKSGEIVRCAKWKNSMQQSTRLPSNHWLHGPHRWRRECGCFRSQGGKIRAIRSDGGDGRVNFTCDSSLRGGGRSHHRPHNNQPLTSMINTVVAPRMVAIVWGLFWLYCGRKAITEATEISWLRCSSRGRGLVVVVGVLLTRSASVMLLSHNDQFRNLNCSIPWGYDLNPSGDFPECQEGQ